MPTQSLRSKSSITLVLKPKQNFKVHGVIILLLTWQYGVHMSIITLTILQCNICFLLSTSRAAAGELQCLIHLYIPTPLLW